MPWDPFQLLCQLLLQPFGDSVPPSVSNFLWKIISAVANPYQTINCNCLLQSPAQTSLDSLTGFLSFSNLRQMSVWFCLFTSADNQDGNVIADAFWSLLMRLDFASLPLFCISLQHFGQCNQLTKLWKQTEVCSGKAEPHKLWSNSIHNNEPYYWI